MSESGAPGAAGAGGAAGSGGGAGAIGAGGSVAAGAGSGGSAESGGSAGFAESGGSAGLAGSGGSAGSGQGGAQPIEPASTFHGGNWADARDNFVNGNLQLSGLSSASDTYATVTAKADRILADFQTLVGVNAVRIPINEPTVLGSWWPAYKGAIDAAVGRGLRVLIPYWAWHNGKPDDMAKFYSMWKTVVDAYADDNLVYFEIFNEPYGYQPSAFIDLAVQWMSTYPNIPKGRIIIAGTHYDQSVTQQGADSRLDGTLLALHIYPFSNSTQKSTAGWQSMLQADIGKYGNRTIVTEWGAPMTTGIDYSGTGEGNHNESFIVGMSSYLRKNKIGSCYWPVLRNADPWSLTTLNGSGTTLSLSANNTSGLARIKSAFGL